MKEIYNAEDINKAQVAIKAFELDYEAKYPKAVDDLDMLHEFYKYPAAHWVHLRTTNPIESTFATVRLRTKVTKGSGSRAAGLAMAYKVIDAQARWRAVNAPHLVALVRAGAVFHKGKLLEQPIDIRYRGGRACKHWIGGCLKLTHPQELTISPARRGRCDGLHRGLRVLEIATGRRSHERRHRDTDPSRR